MRSRLLSFLVGGFFICCLVLLWGRQYQILTVKAEELTEDIENGYFSLDEEDTEDSDSVLSDVTGVISLNEDTNNDIYSEDYTFDTERNDVSEDSEENAENVPIMNDDQFRIMIIFCFGLCAGVIVGHFLTGFIK